MTRSPGRFCSRDGKLCCYGRLECDFLALVPCFLRLASYVSYFLFIPVCLSVQQSSATLGKYVVRVLSFWCHLYPASSRNSFCFFLFVFSILFVVLISRVAFLLCSRTRYVSTWFASLDSFATFVFLSHCVEWVRAVCARLGGKVVAVEGLTDVLADKRKIN